MKNAFTECLEYSKLANKTEPVKKNSNGPRTESIPKRKDDKVMTIILSRAAKNKNMCNSDK